MTDDGDYSVRKSGGSPEVWGVGQAPDDGIGDRDRAKKNAQRRKKRAAKPAEEESPAVETDDRPDETEDGHTVDHVA